MKSKVGKILHDRFQHDSRFSLGWVGAFCVPLWQRGWRASQLWEYSRASMGNFRRESFCQIAFGNFAHAAAIDTEVIVTRP
jgi:hypothetical protein